MPGNKFSHLLGHTDLDNIQGKYQESKLENKCKVKYITRIAIPQISHFLS